jgi:hypothetical protein
MTNWCYKHLVRPWTANPYPTSEGLHMVWRFLVGGSLHNPGGLKFLPKQTTLNAITPQLTLGFAGDAMSMWEKPLHFDRGVVDFFSPCDRILLNFEGVITDRAQLSPDQKHTRPMLDALAQMAPKDKLVLSMANNHTADFGEKECRRCLDLLSEEGFTYFGVKASPFIDLTPQVRIVTGTQWSNRGGDYLAWLDDVEQHIRPGAFNALFPHWGYEMDLFPRLSLVERMGQWLKSFDAVVGHHSHNPQPITAYTDLSGVKRLGAYSMGNLSFGMAYRNIPVVSQLTWGAIAKVTLGPLNGQPNRWAIGDLTWSFVECTPAAGKTGFEVRMVEQCKFFPAEMIPA